MAEPRDLADLDVAVAHWHVNAWGGAEYLVTRLAEALEVDTVYTLGSPTPDDPNPYGDVAFEDVLGTLSPAPLRRLQARVGRAFEYALWEDVDWRDLGDPDVLVTSGATTRAVITPADTLHVNYCHSPPRWFYDLYHDRKDSLTGLVFRPVIRHLRSRDVAVDPRVDHYLANSPIVKRRIWKYYKRDAEVLYPPVDLDSYRDDGDEGFYLHLGRLDAEKGVPAVVEAFDGLEERIVFAGGRGDVGSGVLDRIEGSENMEYRGFVDDEEKRDLLATCRAVVFNGVDEDFGIVPVEANASGKAVLARNEGFPAVFVEPGENGLLHDGSAEGITATVEAFESSEWPLGVGDRLEQFSLGSFQGDLRSTLLDRYGGLTVSR